MRLFFRYSRFLEDEVIRLRDENRKLLDRVLVLTTGAPLEIPPPAADEPPLTPEERARIRAAVDKKADDSPYGGLPTFSALLENMEADSFEKDATAITGFEDIEPGASVINAHDATTEEDQARARTLTKEHAIAAAKAVHEYRSGTRPVKSPEGAN